MKRSKSLLLAVSVLAAGVLSVGGIASAQDMEPAAPEPSPSHATFVAELSGFNEVPGAATLAKGFAGYQLSADHSMVYYTIFATDASTQITAAHIHVGLPGVAGPVVVPLCGTATTPTCAGEGEIISGTFTAEALSGPFASNSMEFLLDQMRQGNTYTNIHSTKFPAGEARGQNVDLSNMLQHMTPAGDQPSEPADMADHEM
jgi:hypothetical protein